MSWNGTVRCGHCGQKGHNKTGCDELRKEWVRDPNGYYGKEWARILARKEAPKTCSYCDETGHTRSGCALVKKHKVTYARDLLLWRKAIEKYFISIGYGPCALVKYKMEVPYITKINGKAQWTYSDDQTYPGPPFGMVPASLDTVSFAVQDHLSVMLLPVRYSVRYPRMGSMELLNDHNDWADHNRSVPMTLPLIPGLFPRIGVSVSGDEEDRVEVTKKPMINDPWEIVSRSPKKDVKPFGNSFTAKSKIKEKTKERFSRDEGRSPWEHKEFTPEHRNILQAYIDGFITISDMESVTTLGAFVDEANSA
jgi:hypothetical protein